MLATIKKSNAKGVISAKPSKSMLHRHIICAALSSSRSVIENISKSEDILATLDCIESLGAKYIINDDSELIIKGLDNIFSVKPKILKCRESGSTLRFMIPIALASDVKTTLTGSERLLSRPLDIYEDICKQEGFIFKKDNKSLEIKGRLKSKDYIVRGDISSQFITGLLFVLPLLGGDSRIIFSTQISSKAYIDMTIKAMAYSNVRVSWQNHDTIYIKGGQKYEPVCIACEGDFSNSAFLDCLNYFNHNSVEVKGLDMDSMQPDKIYYKYFEKINKDFCELDINNCPDLGPILMAFASVRHGVKLTGTKRLAIKESDRGKAMKAELEKLGANIIIEDDYIIVNKADFKYTDKCLDSHNDHRIVMALSIVLTLVGGSISRCEAVSKSYPDFFDDLKSLGIEVNISED